MDHNCKQHLLDLDMQELTSGTSRFPGGGFLARMKQRELTKRSKQTPPQPVREEHSHKSAKSRKSRGKPRNSSDDPISALPCSPGMKSFVRKEFERELASSCLPEAQVKLAVVHRYRTMVANSEERKKGAGRPSKLGRVIPKPQDEVVIEDFDSDQLEELPAEGSLALEPSGSELGKNTTLLLRFNQDEMTEVISDSSQEVMDKPISVTSSKATPKKKHQKPKKMMKAPLTPSPTEADCSYSWQAEASPADSREVPGEGRRCSQCRERGRELLVCSGCSVAAYCGPQCQGEAWRGGHREQCKTGGGAKGTTSTDDGAAAVLDNNTVKSVCINSQPEYEPSQVQEDRPCKVLEPRSILKRKAGDSLADTPTPVRRQVFEQEAGICGEEPGDLVPSEKEFVSKEGAKDLDTPPNSPALVRSVRRSSEVRPSVRRVRGRRDLTPHPCREAELPRTFELNFDEYDADEDESDQGRSGQPAAKKLYFDDDMVDAEEKEASEQFSQASSSGTGSGGLDSGGNYMVGEVMEEQDSGAAGKDWCSGDMEAGEEELEKAQEIEAVDKLGMFSSPYMFSQGEEGDQPTDLGSNKVAEEELEECLGDPETEGKELKIDGEERKMDQTREEKENSEEQEKSEEDEKSEVEEKEGEEDESSVDLVTFSNPVVEEIVMKKVQDVEVEEAGVSASPEMFSQGVEGGHHDQLAGLFSDEPELEEDEDGDDWIDL